MSFIRNTTLNTLRHKLLCILLEITILAAILHSCDRSHSTIYFIFSSLIKFECSRALVASCEHASHHADIGTCCDGLGDISGIFDTAVCNDRDSVAVSHFITIHNCSNLRNTNTCNNTCCTDRSRSDTNFDCIYSSLDQSLGSFACCNITCDYLKLRICCLDLADCF